MDLKEAPRCRYCVYISIGDPNGASERYTGNVGDRSSSRTCDDGIVTPT